MSKYVIALDQGTTSSRSILYDISGKEIRSASRQLPNYFPKDGWVEQDALEIWQTQRDSFLEVAEGIDASLIKAVGISNQRETLIAWDRSTGIPLHKAIVWQCKRSATICEGLKAEGYEDLVKKKTGLIIDSYFSATKIAWLIKNCSKVKKALDSNALVFGTVDAWLLYNLTGGKDGGLVCTEPSNASRTMLFSLQTGGWDQELLDIIGIEMRHLPKIKASNADFGETKLLSKPVPITGMLGDQQAALFGHGCTKPSSAKCTFGTGAFLLMNIGSDIKTSNTGLITTVASKLKSTTTFAFEGSVFMAGALIQWLCDGLGIIENPKECEALAKTVEDSLGVFMVPAFVGLGAPHWDSSARGTIFGLTRDVNKAHIARAALEAVAHQVADFFDAKEFASLKELRIDGGMVVNRLFCQILANITQKKVLVPAYHEVTAFGAAKIALGTQHNFSLYNNMHQFIPNDADVAFIDGRQRWKKAVERSKGWL